MGIRGWFRFLFKRRTLYDWFRVRFDETRVYIEAEPPGRNKWKDSFRWEDINRVCYEVGGLSLSDSIYVFTNKREGSYVIPIEADGGPKFWKKLIGLGYFNPELALKAAEATEGLFKWPPK